MNIYKIKDELSKGVSINDINLRVTYYCRVSTDHLDQVNSLKNQKSFFENKIKENPNWIYVSGYIDEGITGVLDFKRENFMKMINDAKLNKFDLILTKEISRFSRNTLDSIKYTRELLNYGVFVYFINDNINTALSDSELRLTIMSSMAQDEVRRLSERVKFGMKESIKKGIILGNNQLYGYKQISKDKLEIVESEAEVIRKLFSLYAIKNYSLSKIAKIFNEQNIPTRFHKKWCTSTLGRMIQNPKYMGYYCGNKSEVTNYLTKEVKQINKGNWLIFENKKNIPPIINEELFKRANIRFNKRKTNIDKTIYKNRYPLSAKIICENDLCIYHRRKQLKSSNDITWICSNSIKSKNKCKTANIRESEIYEIFNRLIGILEIDFNKVIDIMTSYYKESNINNNLKQIKKEKDKIIIKKEKLLELNLEGVISKEEFVKENDKLNKKLSELDNNLYVNNENIDYEKIMMKYMTIDKLINLLLDKIIVKKINDNLIDLKIYLNISKFFIKDKFVEFNMLFKRGFDTKCTKRYVIEYHNMCYSTTFN